MKQCLILDVTDIQVQWGFHHKEGMKLPTLWEENQVSGKNVQKSAEEKIIWNGNFAN